MTAIQNHPNCTKPDCSQCLADCLALRAELEERSGLTRIDHLLEYRRFLEGEGFKSVETEHGWPHPFVFEESNINAYLESLK